MNITPYLNNRKSSLFLIDNRTRSGILNKIAPWQSRIRHKKLQRNYEQVLIKDRRHREQQHPRSSEWNPSRKEIPLTGTNCSNKQVMPDHQSQTISNVGPTDSMLNKLIKGKRTKWIREEYPKFMTSFFTAFENPYKNITDHIYQIQIALVANGIGPQHNTIMLVNIHRDIV